MFKQKKQLKIIYKYIYRFKKILLPQILALRI
jgi:hypothetical protein